jgi:hypothetical protein
MRPFPKLIVSSYVSEGDKSNVREKLYPIESFSKNKAGLGISSCDEIDFNIVI